MPVLIADGFTDVEVFGPHAEPDGDFPNVPKPRGESGESGGVRFDHRACQETQADVILATDPDCDRLGVAAPRSPTARALGDVHRQSDRRTVVPSTCLRRERRPDCSSPEHYVVKTLVTTEMIRRIAEAYKVKTYGDLQVGFKWIGTDDRRVRP